MPIDTFVPIGDDGATPPGGWPLIGASTRWEAVDEITPNLNDYIRVREAESVINIFEFDFSTIYPGATIHGVKVYVHYRHNKSPVCRMRLCDVNGNPSSPEDTLLFSGTGPEWADVELDSDSDGVAWGNSSNRDTLVNNPYLRFRGDGIGTPGNYLNIYSVYVEIFWSGGTPPGGSSEDDAIFFGND